MSRLLAGVAAGVVLAALLAGAVLYIADLSVDSGGVKVPWVGNRSVGLAEKELEAMGLDVKVEIENPCPLGDPRRATSLTSTP